MPLCSHILNQGILAQINGIKPIGLNFSPVWRWSFSNAAENQRRTGPKQQRPTSKAITAVEESLGRLIVKDKSKRPLYLTKSIEYSKFGRALLTIWFAATGPNEQS
jgi:hypothetical protein